MLTLQYRKVSYRSPMIITKVSNYAGGVHPICPRCHIGLDREYMAYCDRCGQKLSWGRYDVLKYKYSGR